MNFVQPIRSENDIELFKEELKRGGSRDYMMGLFCMNTGLRISDILALKVLDVKGKDVFYIIEKNTDKQRSVYLNAALQREIGLYTKNLGDDEYLFASRKGHTPINRVTAYDIVKKAADACGIENIGTQSLRKTFGYHHYKKYKDVAMLQEIFHHSSPSITLRYIGISNDDIQKILADFSL